MSSLDAVVRHGRMAALNDVARRARMDSRLARIVLACGAVVVASFIVVPIAIHLIGRRREPLRAAEPRLESDVGPDTQLFAEQPRGFLAMAMIGVAALEGSLRHSMETKEKALRLEVKRSDLTFDVRPERVDVYRIVVIRRKGPKGRLATHRGELSEHCVHRAGRGCRAILRIERGDQDLFAAEAEKVLD